MIFARLFDTPHGQGLLRITLDDNGNRELRFSTWITEIDAHVELVVPTTTDVAAEIGEKALAEFSAAKAEAAVLAMRTMVMKP